MREAIFSALDARDIIAGATVLDLYAGTGALGLEAASRGAAQVTLVEKAANAANVAKKNAARIRDRAPAGSPVRIEVVSQAVSSFLRTGPGVVAFWNIVFMDPPYDLSNAEVDVALAALVAHMTDDGLLVLERSSRSPEPAWPAGFELERRKDYGDTTLFWVRRVVEVAT